MQDQSQVTVIEDNSLPEQLGWDQENEVLKKNAKIKQIGKNSKNLLGLSEAIHGKVEKQGETLDKMNEQTEQNIKNVKDGADDLKKAEEMSKKSNSCLIYVVGASVIMLVVLIFLSLIAMMFN